MLFQVDSYKSSVDSKGRLDPNPPALSKDDLISDAGAFTEVDKHARSVIILLNYCLVCLSKLEQTENQL